MAGVDYSQDRAFARLAGIFYLTIAVSGGFAIAYVPTSIVVPDDPLAALSAMADSRGLFLAGIGGDVVMMLAEVALTVMLFFMFRGVSPVLSGAAALARFAMVGVMAAMLFFSAAAVALTDGTLMPDIGEAERAEWLNFFFYLDQVGVWIWQIFFALHLMILGD